MSIEEKRFKKLYKQLSYEQSELEYVCEILKTAHWDFEDYYREYCKDKGIDLEILNEKHSERVERLLPSHINQKYDKNGDLETEKVVMKDNTDMKEFKKVYREIAKILHPDKGGEEKEFKKATDALANKNWSVILEICEKYNIKITDYKSINKLLKNKIDQVKDNIEKEKSTYSWLFHQCEEAGTCRDNVVKKFLKHLFDYF